MNLRNFASSLSDLNEALQLFSSSSSYSAADKSALEKLIDETTQNQKNPSASESATAKKSVKVEEEEDFRERDDRSVLDLVKTEEIPGKGRGLLTTAPIYLV